jgi:DNA replication protein DnaC
MSRRTNRKDEYLEEVFKKLKLLDIRENYQDAIGEAIEAKEGYKEFPIRIATMEMEGRERRRGDRMVMQAGFDYIKTLDDIEYEFNNSINYQRIKGLGTLEFMDRSENIIIIGPPGVGKSMIATGIGINACRAGKKVIFANAKELTDDLYDSMREGRLKEELKRIDKAQLLIVDELSYLKMDKERESIFFQIVRQRYEKSSLIITTNLPLGRWDEVFTGQLAATAILDRLVHHCHVINITGDSFRVKGNDFLRNKEGV